MYSTKPIIDLGEPQAGVRFDDAFDVAKRVLMEFEAEAVTFTLNARTIRVEHSTTAGEAFDEMQNDPTVA